MKLIFVLDESGSIGTSVNYAPQVQAGVLAFLNALNGQNIQAALIEFSDLATVVNNYTIINNAYIQNITNYFNGIPYLGQTYFPNGGTNWHDAMKKVDAMTSANLVLFFTDGEPTVYTKFIWKFRPLWNGNGRTTQPPEIVNPVKSQTR